MFKQALWDFVGRFINYFVTFAVGIVLTRLLSPEEFGIFGIVMAIVLFSNVFLDFGFRIALIQAKEINQTQLSTVFFINLVVSFCIFVFITVSSTSIGAFYGNEDLAKPIVVMSTLFIINALMLVPNALLNRAMRFKPISIANTISSIAAGGIGVFLAYSGFKIWALIFQNLLATTFLLIGLFIIEKWKPSLTFSLNSVKPLWKLSSTVFFLTILDSIYTRLDVFIIGKLFNFTTLGFYNRAQSVDGLVRNLSVGTLMSVVLPFFSKIQDDEEALKIYYERSINLVLFISLFLSGFLFLSSLDIIVILFTEKWATVASYFKIIAITSFIYPVSAVMVNIIVARGNSKEFIKLEVFKKLILTPVYLFIFFGGVYEFLIALGFVNFINVNVNAHFVEKEIGVTKLQILKFIIKYAGVAVISGIFSYLISYNFSDNHYLHLFITFTAFIIPYVTISYYLKLTGLLEIFSKIRELSLTK